MRKIDEIVDRYLEAQGELFSALQVSMVDADLVEDHRGEPWDTLGGLRWTESEGDEFGLDTEVLHDPVSRGGLTFFYCENNGNTFWMVFRDEDREDDS